MFGSSWLMLPRAHFCHCPTRGSALPVFLAGRWSYSRKRTVRAADDRTVPAFSSCAADLLLRSAGQPDGRHRHSASLPDVLNHQLTTTAIRPAGASHRAADHRGRIGRAQALTWNMGTTGRTRLCGIAIAVGQVEQAVQHGRSVRIQNALGVAVYQSGATRLDAVFSSRSGQIKIGRRCDEIVIELDAGSCAAALSSVPSIRTTLFRACSSCLEWRCNARHEVLS